MAREGKIDISDCIKFEFKFEDERIDAYDEDAYKTDHSDEFSFCRRCPRQYGVIPVDDRIKFLESSSMLTIKDINSSLDDDKKNYLYLPINDENSCYDPLETILRKLELIFNDEVILANDTSRFKVTIPSNRKKGEYIPVIGAPLGQLPDEIEKSSPVFLIISPNCNAIKSISIPNMFVWDQIKGNPTKNIYSFGNYSKYDYQIREKIDLSMIMAIGIADSQIKRYSRNYSQWDGTGYSTDEVIVSGLTQDRKARYLSSILELMSEYGIELPIIDVVTGKPITIDPEKFVEESVEAYIDKRKVNCIYYCHSDFVRKKVLTRWGIK